MGMTFFSRQLSRLSMGKVWFALIYSSISLSFLFLNFINENNNWVAFLGIFTLTMILPWGFGFIDSKCGWTFRKSKTDAKFFSHPYTELNRKMDRLNGKIDHLIEKIYRES
jgi:uncharacterized membrane protein YqjE